MESVILFFLAVLIWESIVWLFNRDMEDVSMKLAKILALIRFILLIAIFIQFIIIVSKPTAIDVYQGKTTLEITYKNGVPIDSVVVHKDK